MTTTSFICSVNRRAILPALLLLAMLKIPGAFAAGPASVADLAERLSAAVVNISTSQKAKRARRGGDDNGRELPPNFPFREYFEDYFNRSPDKDNDKTLRRPVSSLGSGFVIDASGVVITNNHVIEQAEEIFVNFSDGEKLEATIVGRDPKTDIAVLQVKPEAPLAHVAFGDSNAIRVGDWVLAIGNPFGFSGSVTLGIVSARNRDINSGPYDDYIQTDAAINRGNSGGPLFNMDGKVIGINTAIISPTGGSIGLGFAVPAATARGVISQLREFGETRRGWLGVKIQTVTDDMAEALSLDEAHGALVADVTEDSPAAAAGLQPGDVIVKYNGIDVERMRDLPKLVAETAVGEESEVEVVRKGETLSFKVILGRLEEGEKLAALSSPEADDEEDNESNEQDVLGMKLAKLTEKLRTEYKIGEDVSGVVVTSVDPDSPAARKRVQPGDVISEAGGEPVSAPGDMTKQVEDHEARDKSTIMVLIHSSRRNGFPRFIALRLKDG